MRTEKNESGYSNGPNISERMKYFAGNQNSRKILRYITNIEFYNDFSEQSNKDETKVQGLRPPSSKCKFHILTNLVVGSRGNHGIMQLPTQEDDYNHNQHYNAGGLIVRKRGNHSHTKKSSLKN